MSIHLTLRQAQVLTGLAAGMSYTAMANEFGINDTSVRNIANRAKKHFGVPTVEAMMVIALRSRSLVDFKPIDLEILWPGKVKPTLI